MKKSKKVLAVLLAVTIIAGVTVFAACTTGGSAAISENAAKQIAYATLNATAADVQSATVERDTVGGAKVYDVEFFVNGVKYEIKVNADTGAVVNIEINNQTVTAETLPVSPLSDKSQYIGADAALTAALNDAGVTASDVVVSENKFDFDDGKYLYEIEFRVTATGAEYDYEIDALNGGVYKKDVDYVTVKVPTPSTQTVTYISVETAKANAIAAVEGATVDNITLTKATFEVDDGLHVYDVEFTYGNKRYEFEINAVTGAVYCEEIDDVIVVAPENANYIGVEAALEIALNKAGLTAADVTVTKKAFDMDDGYRPVYEIEFRTATREYEVEINAESGKVTDYENELFDGDDDDDDDD